MDDWGEFYYGRSCPKWSVTEDATIPCIRYGELYTKFGTKIDKVYSYTNMPSESLRFSKGTEVLIPRVGEDPMDYNHCTWLSMPDVAIGEMISVFNTDNNPLFTATMFNATLQYEFAMRVEGGSVTNLYFEKLKNIAVSFPSLVEQEKVASYFQSIDHLITLHQRKCRTLGKKKLYAWEQRKLGEVAEKVYGGGTPKTSEEEFWGGNIPWFQSADLHEHEVQLTIPKKAITTLGLQKSAAQLVPGNSIAIVTRVGVGKLVFMPFSYATSQDFLSLSELNIDEKFGCYAIYRLLQREKKLTQGTSIKGITKNEILQKKIAVPNKMEQKKVGDYFTGLDTLITLHQRQLFYGKSTVYHIKFY